MRKVFAPAALALLASGAYAQGEIAGATDSAVIKMEWDGTAETYWKIFFPSGASDYFNVDTSTLYAGDNVIGVVVNTLNTGAVSADGLADLGLYINKADFITPNLASSVGNVDPTALADVGPDSMVINIPDILPLGAADTSIVAQSTPGDSTIWIGGDSNGPQFGNSYFTTDGYSTPAIPFTTNWTLGIACLPGGPVSFWANGATSTTISETENLAFLFVGGCTFQPFMIFLTNCVGGLIIPAVNIVLFTGIGAIDDAGTTATFSAAWPCNVFTGTLCFRAVYKDCPPGKKILLTNEVSVTVNPSGVCSGSCFGQLDDGVLDATIWKVQNPAGSNDYFNIEHGAATGAVNTLTDVEVASWNFCGVAAPWDEVGVYDSNLTLDPTGATPATPALASVLGQSVPAAQSDWGYPATTYNHSDYVVGGGENFHAAAKWAGGDSCIWMGSDTDGADPTSCPVSLTSSYFTLDGYATPALLLSGAAWMMKINFQ